MANRRNQKLKLLTLERIFRDKTDETHGLTMNELLDELEARGVETERKSIYTSIAALREAGINVEKRNGTTVTYGLANRPFKAQEVVLLADALTSSGFLSEESVERATEQLTNLVCEPMRPYIRSRIDAISKPKTQNIHSVDNVDTLMRAIVNKNVIVFKYFYYDIEAKPAFCRGGASYHATPLHLVYTDGVYYLVGYDEDSNDLVNYRVDHMVDIQITNIAATNNEKTRTHEEATVESAKFNMQRGEVTTASLIVEERAMNNVLDKFGTDIAFFPLEGNKARCHVKIVNCPAFYGWLLKQGTGVIVEKPARVVEMYKAYLRASLDMYEDMEANE